MVNVSRLSGLGLSLLTFVLVCGCDNPPAAPSGPYTLSGVVTQMTSSGRVPIRGVFVEETTIHRQAITDDNGRYKLAALPAGVATIQVSMLRFETASRSATMNGNVTIDVELQQRELFILSGFVTEETAAGLVPVAGVDVEVMVCPPQPRGSARFEGAETDANGFYSIAGMCDGATVLYGEKTGYDLQPTFDKPCGNEGEYCRWVTMAGNTRFDFQLSRQ